MNKLKIVFLIVMLVYHVEKKYVIQEGRSATLQTLRDVGYLEKE